MVILPFTRSSSRDSFLRNNRITGINREKDRQTDRRGDRDRGVGHKQANLYIITISRLFVSEIINKSMTKDVKTKVIGTSLLANTYLLTRSYVAVYSHGRHRNRSAKGAHSVNWTG